MVRSGQNFGFFSLHMDFTAWQGTNLYIRARAFIEEKD